MQRRHLLTQLGGGLTGGSLLVGSASASRDWQQLTQDGSSDGVCGERDYQCQGARGYQYSETVRRGGQCEFTNKVVFPILTAVSMEDGIPISTKAVATGWAATSTACYAMDEMEDVHGEVTAASVQLQANEEHTLMMPR